MKPGEITLGTYTDFINEAKKRFDPTKAKARSAFESGAGFLKKFKMEAEKNYAVLIPLEVALPFDPTDLNSDAFDRHNPLPLAGSPTTAIRGLKLMAKNDPALAEKLAQTLQVEVKDLNLDVDSVESSEIKMWHKLCRIQYITGYVQHLNTNHEKFAFGRKVGAEVILDDEGNVQDTKGVGYRLYELESALISVEIQMLKDTYEPGGVNADRPAKDMEAAIKNLWQNRLVGNPYQIAFCRCAVFTSTPDGSVNSDEITAWNKSKKIGQFIRYQKITRDRIELFESVLTTRSDMNMDFVEITVNVPKAENGRINYMSVNYGLANKSSSIFQIDEDTGNPINNLKGFIEEFTAYRDDAKVWTDDILRRSIIEYRIPGDSQFIAEVSSNLSTYEDALKSESIFTQYSDILQQLNSSLYSDVAEKILEGDVNGKDIAPAIIETQPIMNENNDHEEMSVQDEFNSLLNELDDTDETDGQF